MTSKLSLSILVGITIIKLVASEPMPNAENVCNRTIAIRKDKLIEVPITYKLKYQGMCQGFIPCEKTRTETRMDSRLIPSVDEVQVATCCPGYAETPDRRCAPVCLNSCKNGQCVAPNTCKCNPEPTETSPGFVGSTCSRYTCLAVDRWGENCDKECNCPSNSYCSAQTGKCLCRNGWRGADCSEECTSSSGCDDVIRPPVIEPEANVIDNIMGSSQKLEAPRNLERFDGGDDVSKSPARFMAAHLELNIFLIALSCFLVFTLIYYRKKLNQLRNELYYAPTSSAASGGSSQYSGPSSGYYAGSSIIGARPLPNPNESNYLSKNMSFAEATRNLLTKGSIMTEKPAVDRTRVALHPAIEQRLINCQEPSKQNLYSEIDSNSSVKAYGVVARQDPNNTVLNLSVSSPESNHYQVPRSASMRSSTTTTTNSNESFRTANDSTTTDQGDNIYEEVKPRK